MPLYVPLLGASEFENGAWNLVKSSHPKQKLEAPRCQWKKLFWAVLPSQAELRQPNPYRHRLTSFLHTSSTSSASVLSLLVLFSLTYQRIDAIDRSLVHSDCVSPSSSSRTIRAAARRADLSGPRSASGNSLGNLRGFSSPSPDYPLILGLYSPLLLCRICRQWRAIAIATPELWRAIKISVSDEAPAQLKLFKTWLSRSVSRPLSMYPSLRRRTHAIEKEILRTAVLHSERWEYANLFLSFGNLGLLRVTNAMPLLQHLTFGFEGIIPSEPITLFDRAPRLKQVVLTTGFNKSDIAVPWGQLTCLDAHFLYPRECAEILRDATNLVHCSFGICRPNIRNPTLIPTIPIRPYLRHLVLRPGKHSHSSFDLSGLFRNLTLPGLLTLRVYEPSITLESLGEFISRSQCTLQVLCIDGSPVPENTYREALPSITTITVRLELFPDDRPE
jgi:hypothetical protein